MSASCDGLIEGADTGETNPKLELEPKNVSAGTLVRRFGVIGDSELGDWSDDSDSSDSSGSSSECGPCTLTLDVLRSIAEAARINRGKLQEKLKDVDGHLLELPWPHGNGLMIVRTKKEWRPAGSSDTAAWFRRYCCCGNVQPEIIGSVVCDAPGGKRETVKVFVDQFGRFYAYRDPPDDALYLLALTPEDLAVLGLRHLYPLHCCSEPYRVGTLLWRLWELIRGGAGVEVVKKFIVREYGETVEVARGVIGGRERLRFCELGCLRWERRKKKAARMLRRAEKPPLEENIVSLGRVLRVRDVDVGVPVYVGVPSGRVYAGDMDVGRRFLVADSIPGFSGLGVSRLHDNRRYGRRDLEERKLRQEREPSCLMEM